MRSLRVLEAKFMWKRFAKVFDFFEDEVRRVRFDRKVMIIN